MVADYATMEPKFQKYKTLATFFTRPSTKYSQDVRPRYQKYAEEPVVVKATITKPVLTPEQEQAMLEERAENDRKDAEAMEAARLKIRTRGDNQNV